VKHLYIHLFIRMKAIENYQGFIELLKCHESKKIFFNPVLYENVVYEKQELTEHINKISHQNVPNPIFEDPNLPKTTKILSIQSLVTNMLKVFPQLQNQQYVEEFNNKYTMNVSFIHEQLRNNNYDVLLKYKEYDLNMMSCDLFSNILKHAKPETSLYFLNNIIDDSKQWFNALDDYVPIYFVFKICNTNIIKNVISKISGLNKYMVLTLEEVIYENDSLTIEDKIILQGIIEKKLIE